MSLPATLSDAIQQFRDGQLGKIETIKIGDLVVDALTDMSAPSVLTVTRKPIEKGYNITDAAIREPLIIDITIALTNPDYSASAAITAAVTGNLESLNQTWRDKHNDLYQIHWDREIVKYQSHEGVYSSMIISVIDPIWNVDENYDAFFAHVTLEQITIIETDVNKGSFDGGVNDKGQF